MGINLCGEWSCMKFELQQMRKQGSGAIADRRKVILLAIALARSRRRP
jgi:hypothetical protein